MATTSIRATDEETPLLPNHPQQKTPLPQFQFALVILLQLAESLTAQVISPFAPQLIRDLGITGGDETKVGYYVGMLYSLFFLIQAGTVLYWSRLSDRVGRKPAILIGIFGLSISMYCFGLSTTFLGVLMCRAANGAVNGNTAVFKSMMAELTDSTNIAQESSVVSANAFSFNSLAWASGGILGPVIGGLLAHPAERFPSIFGDSSFLKKYPYFLPCAVPATYSAITWIIAYLYLKETVKHPTSFRELIFKSTRKTEPNQNGSTPKHLPFKSLLVFRVIIAASNYACLALVDISFRAIQPLFLSTPIELGGLGLPPSTIGAILSFFGVINGFCQIFFFPKVHHRWGSKKVFIAGLAACIPLYLLFPVINYLASKQGLTPIVWAAVSTQVMLSMLLNFSYSAIFIFIADAAPNKSSVGATNGLCQVVVSMTRAFGPAAASSLFSLSMAHNWFGGYLVYYVFVLVIVMALFVASKLPRSL